MFTNRGALSGASDDEREAAVAEIEALLPRWHQAIHPGGSK